MTMSFYRFGLSVALVGLLGGCVSRDEPIAGTSPAPMQTRAVRTAPPANGDLELGMPAAREGGPAYVRSGINSSTRQTDAFGNGVLPQGF
jgi:hypothetical protein